jgi:hypothetical protein
VGTSRPGVEGSSIDRRRHRLLSSLGR